MIANDATVNKEEYMNTAAKQDVQVIEPRAVAQTPMDLLNQAVANGNIELAEKLMGLQERWEKNQARKAFDNAMSAAKAEIPVIIKNRVVDFTSQKGRTNYRHEDMAGIARIVDPILSKYGLSYRYRTLTDQGIVTVTCIVSHRDGHSEENCLSAGRDETGNKNNIQAVGSTITYLQRYTLKAALGLAASDDVDANAVALDPIATEQVEIIRSLIVEVGADIPKFCKYMKVEKIENIGVKDFDRAVAALEAKRSKS
jgi:hypothetical protein